MKNAVICLLVTILLIISGFGIAGCARPAEEAFPTEDIHFIVWVGPGGGYDAYARAIAPIMPKYLPKQVNVIVENKPGGGGITGYSYIYNSKPDGYTFGFVSLPGAIVASLVENIPYDMSKVTWLGTACTEELAMFVPAKSPINSWTDVETKLKAGEKLTELVMPGDTLDLQMTILRAESGLDWKTVAGYKTRQEVMLGLIRGDGDFGGAPSVGYAYDYVKNGDTKPILAFSDKPSPYYPNAQYTGKLGYTTVIWSRGLFAPPGVPDSRVKILANALQKTLQDEEFLAWAKKGNVPVGWLGSAETAKRVGEANKLLGKYKDQIQKHFATQ